MEKIKTNVMRILEKAIEMIKVTDINKVTGYIRGGCSPIGMKKSIKQYWIASVRY